VFPVRYEYRLHIKTSYLSNMPWRPLRLLMLGIPHCVDNRLTDGGEAVSLKHR
jgi:hypothetical protein